MNLWLQLKIRDKFGSQAQFSKVIGRDEAWVSRLLHGRLTPSDRDVVVMRQALDLDFEPPKKVGD
jgi:cyanate lyase